jgi:hypothetical protein
MRLRRSRHRPALDAEPEVGVMSTPIIKPAPFPTAHPATAAAIGGQETW